MLHPKLTNDTEADPLLLASLPGSVDSDADLLVTLVQVVNHLLALLLNLRNGSFLLDDQGVHILEQLRELVHLLLDLEQSLVTVLNGTEGSTSAALAVTLHHGLLEHLAIARVLDSSTHFVLGGVRADNAVLTGHLVLRTLAELRLDLLVRGDGGLEIAVDAPNVRAVLGGAGVRVGLDLANTLGQGTVGCHGLGRERVELAIGRAGLGAVGIVEGTLLQHAKLFKVALYALNAAINITALVQDSVGVGVADRGTILCKRCHLD